MSYCAQHDPQANRLLYILTSFRDVVTRQQATTSLQPISGLQSHAFMHTPSMSLGHENGDPIGSLLQTTIKSPEISAASTVPKLHKLNSNLSATSPLPITTDSPEMSLGGSLASNHHDRVHLSRDDSLDAFLDLARVSSNPSGSNDGTDSHSAGDAEIDFEMLWQWPNSNSGLTPGPSGFPSQA